MVAPAARPLKRNLAMANAAGADTVNDNKVVAVAMNKLLAVHLTKSLRPSANL